MVQSPDENERRKRYSTGQGGIDEPDELMAKAIAQSNVRRPGSILSLSKHTVPGDIVGEQCIGDPCCIITTFPQTQTGDRCRKAASCT